jgi:hypothetical protein
MQPNLVTLMQAAELVGWPGKAGRTRLKRLILDRQTEVGRVIIRPGKVQYVNVSDLHQLCPELFPVAYHKECAELRAELRRREVVEAQQQADLEQIADSFYALYEDLLDRSDHQRSSAITRSAMDEGPVLFPFAKPEEDETLNGALNGPTISGRAQSAPSPRQ